MSTETETKPPIPPFSYEDAVRKVRMAEDAWNSRNPDRVSDGLQGLCSVQMPITISTHC